MKKYRITETVTYEVEAASRLEAYNRVLNTDGGLVDHFHGVEDRTISREDPETGNWVTIDEPEGWDA